MWNVFRKLEFDSLISKMDLLSVRDEELPVNTEGT